MNEQSQSFARGRPGQPPAFGNGSPTPVSLRWAAMMDAAEIVAMLAGVECGNGAAEVRNFPARLQREADHWRRTQAAHGIADLTAVLEPGMNALLAINARGGNPAVAARALWQEFSSARSALLGLLPPNGEMGPRRSA